MSLHHLVGVVNHFPVNRDLCSQCKEDLGKRQVPIVFVAARNCDGQTVIADQRLGDIHNTIVPAKRVFRRRHGSGGSGQVGVTFPYAGAEELHAAAGSGGLNDR